MDELEYVRSVLGILADAELTWQDTPVLWRVRWAEQVVFSMACSDTFAWGCADAEEIRPQDVELLRRCLGELRAAAQYAEMWLPLLYCCRKRGMRPMNRYMQYAVEKDGMPQAVVALIEACGPARESVFGAP